MAYRLNNGIPNLITQTLHSNLRKLRTRYNAVYAQEQWSLGRMTLQGAVRFDHAWSYSPEQTVGPTRFLPTPIVFPRTAGVVGYNDISPRLGLAYDVFGNGKTALKVNLGRYLDAASNNNGNYSITNPTSRMAGAPSWAARDHALLDRQRHYVPDCNLNVPTADLRPADGDACGAISDRNFGTATLSRNFDPAALKVWGVRPADWEFGVSIQQEVLPRVSVELGTSAAGSTTSSWTTTWLPCPADYTQFSVTAPGDPRLPNGGGQTISNLYDVVPAKFGQVIGPGVAIFDNVHLAAKHKYEAALKAGTFTRRSVSRRRRPSSSRSVRSCCRPTSRASGWSSTATRATGRRTRPACRCRISIR